MAYDRYDTRGGSRERWRSDDRFDRDRDHGRRDERGFFERAGEEIASWFGDDDDDRRRERGRMSGGREDYGRDQDFRRESGRDRGFFGRDRGEGDRRWDRDDDDRGFFGSRGYRGVSGDGGSNRPMWSTDRGGGREEGRGYRPMTGDYGRIEDRDRGRSDWDQDSYRRTSFAGSAERSGHHDPHYAEWRRRQLEELDRDYDEYRRENQSRFESDFANWRGRRQTKRQMLGQVREHMEVVGSDQEHLGTVDRVAGDRIILTKSDPEAGGVHHSIPCTLVERIEGERVILDCTAQQARERWRDDNRERALFEREDQGEAGPMTLDRSFSGTYR